MNLTRFIGLVLIGTDRPGLLADIARILRELLSRVRIPLCLMPGNHDRRAPLRQALNSFESAP